MIYFFLVVDCPRRFGSSTRRIPTGSMFAKHGLMDELNDFGPKSMPYGKLIDNNFHIEFSSSNLSIVEASIRC